MTAAERTALLKLIARTARVAAADVEQLAAQRYAEFERQAQKVWDAQELGVKQLVADANTMLAPHLAEIRQLVDERCAELGIIPEFRPHVTGEVKIYRPWVTKDRQAEMRRLVKVEIDAARKQAKVEVERSRAAVEAEILTGAITSDEGRAILDRLPSPAELLPAVDAQKILGVGDGGGTP